MVRPYPYSRTSRLLTAGLTLLGLPILPGYCAPVLNPAGHRNLSDAFLPVQARSVAAVVAQVQADPVVQRHYGRYLHMPPARVAAYLRANLVPSRLSHEGQYTVYFVRPNGLIYPTTQVIAKGSPVFALRNGPALLTWNEGDPLVRCQKAVRFDSGKPQTPVTAAPVPPPPPRVRQVIVPTHVETTVVPATPPTPALSPVTVDKTAGE